ncbi:MAG: carboxypeptidase-like regulatory domain-containing protein [Flavobacteriaceae bacterium]|nr:carboxypeptidase-like regulatory domain-containing protein [Flavobacteriaceae bacterium]
MKKIFLILILLSLSLTTYAQQISGKIVDTEFNQPLAFVNIQLTEKKGTITNNEGAYSIDVTDFDEDHMVEFSSMGFESLEVSIQQLVANPDLKMQASIELLDQVIVSDRALTAIEIIEKFKENREQNHQLSNQRYQIFSRGKTEISPEQMMFKLKKANNLKRKERKKINDALDEVNQRVSGSKTLYFSESLKNVYKNDTVFLTDFIKNISLTDTDTKTDIEEYQKEALKQLIENIESEHTFKVKIGIIKVADSVDVNSDEDSLVIGTSDGESEEEDEEEEDEEEEDEEEADDEETPTEVAFKRNSLLDEKDIPSVLRETDYYEYTLEEASVIKGRPQYVISFQPDKRKAKFEGKMYIDQEDFALTQIDYQLAEGKKLESINLKLLGIKFNQYQASYSMRYAKNEEGFYIPYYVSETEGRYIFLRRTLTFIENHPNRKERLKFKLRFIIELNSIEARERVLLEQESFDFENLDTENLKTTMEAEVLETYDASIWKDYPVFEATQEMKSYHLK